MLPSEHPAHLPIRDAALAAAMPTLSACARTSLDASLGEAAASVPEAAAESPEADAEAEAEAEEEAEPVGELPSLDGRREYASGWEGRGSSRALQLRHCDSFLDGVASESSPAGDAEDESAEAAQTPPPGLVPAASSSVPRRRRRENHS